MVLLMAAEIEHELISQRTKEALARRKAAIARMYGSSWQTVLAWVRRKGNLCGLSAVE